MDRGRRPPLFRRKARRAPGTVCSNLLGKDDPVAPPDPHQRTRARARRPLGRACAAALVLSAAGCAGLSPVANERPRAAGAAGAGMREHREVEMNRRWQDQPLAQLVAALGQPMLTLNIPGGGNPPGFVVVYGEDDSSGCIDAFAVNSGGEPRIRMYYCR